MKESIVTSSPMNKESGIQLYCFITFVAL